MQDSSTKDVKANRIWLRGAVGFLLFLLLLPAALMASAGTLAWPMGWVLIVLMMGSTVVSRLIALRKFPDLLRERGSYTSVEGVKPWDRLIVGWVGLIGPLITFIVAGLDHRLGWSPHVPSCLGYVALFLIVLGFGMGVWAMAVNRFFSAVVRIQHERGHHVVDKGPYRWIRHPSYAGAVLAYIAIPFMLDAIWALVPASLMCALVIVRTKLEDQALMQELPGYPEYARKTPFRLLPGIW